MRYENSFVMGPMHDWTRGIEMCYACGMLGRGFELSRGNGLP